ncbi:MAG: polysaccharide pyruvyl transferase family protein [Eggerthellaceae bacterium]|nr:polysaccharide pyruvyl transferase family protein [Eggerthellaceae bacterium]
MIRVLLIADNRAGLNTGCRGTSIALRAILEQDFIIEDTITRDEKSAFAIGVRRTSSTEENARLISHHNPEKYQEIIERIKRVDAVVLNGEGSFIFSSPPRNEMLDYLVYLHLCLQYNKPFFVVNTVFSRSSTLETMGVLQDGLNVTTLDETLRFIRFAQLVTVRDRASYNFLKACDINNTVNVKYVPDALFSWYELYNNKAYAEVLDHMLEYPQFSLSHDMNETLHPKFDFEQNYAVFSLNSFKGTYQLSDQTKDRLIFLVKALKVMLSSYDTNLYLLEACCHESAFLSEVAKQLSVPRIPVNTNIFLLGRILGRSLCYVTGRFHASILASLGGTPCVLMGSNCHKTEALQTLLMYPEDQRRIYQANPDEAEANDIVAAAETIIKERSTARRESIRNACNANSNEAKRLSTIMKSYLLESFGD